MVQGFIVKASQKLAAIGVKFKFNGTGFQHHEERSCCIEGDKGLGFKPDRKLSAAMGGMRVWNLPMNCKPRAALWDTRSRV